MFPGLVIVLVVLLGLVFGGWRSYLLRVARCDACRCMTLLRTSDQLSCTLCYYVYVPDNESSSEDRKRSALSP